VRGGAAGRAVAEGGQGMDEQPRQDLPAGRSVLIVDDSRTTRRVVRRALELARLGIADIAEAADGEEAWAHLQAHPCDAILTDIHMPRLGGVALIERLLADPRLRRVPVVVLTSEGGAGRLGTLRALRVSGYIHKPFRPERVRDALRDLWGDAPGETTDEADPRVA